MMVDHKTILVYFTFGSVFLSSVYSSTVVNMDKCTGIYCVAPECDRGDMFVPEGECCLVCPKDKCSGVVCPDCPNQGRPDGECCPFCSIGVAFLPQPNIVSTLIRFNKARASTFTPYVDHLESFLQYYENPYQLTAYGMTVYCSTFTEFRPHEDWDKACTFDIVDLGADCVKQQSFGYEDGQPCVMLKLNRIFDWMPEPYTNETRPDAIADTWTQYAISVKCEGENPADKDNIGDIYYFPSNGFPFYYFPYRNQQGYKSPLVFVRFDNPKPAQLFMITCKVYARNIKHNSNERAGMVHFELIVD